MAANNSTKIALYARVSTKNNGQNPETQLLALREYAKARGFQVFNEYVDAGISGSKERRPALDRLMKDARRRKFDAVLVARFESPLSHHSFQLITGITVSPIESEEEVSPFCLPLNKRLILKGGQRQILLAHKHR